MSTNKKEYKQINKILGNYKKLDKLKNNLIQIPEIKIKNWKYEKKIQELITKYFEYRLNIDIVEESFADIPELQKHNYLLIDILKEHIDKLNKDIFNDFNHIPKNKIIDIILNDFINRFDNTKNNIEKHNLYFKKTIKTVKLEDKNGKEKTVYYNIIDLVNYSNNKITIIKEKRIVDKKILKKFELPDFAYYVNGIPFIAIEIKTPETGINAASKDYYNKKSYHNFLATIGTDGIKAFITSNNNIFFWQNYGNEISNEGFKDLSEELLFNINNLLLYFQYGVNSKDNEILMNARVQQYFVLKYFYELFKKLLKKQKQNKSIKFRNYFKHHTRSGKSFTFTLLLNLLGNGHDNFNNYFSKLYKKVYIITHDLTVKNNLVKEFSNRYFGNYGYIKVIESKKDYLNSLKDNSSNIYILNIQKTELEKDEKKLKNNIYKNEDILFLIDEVHTHQNIEDGYAYVRNKSFPNASYISATATPIIKETKDGIMDVTEKYFGDQIDNFSPSDAVKLQIVVPLLYEKYSWNVKNDDGNELTNIKERINKLNEIIKELSVIKIEGGEYKKYGFNIEEEGKIEEILHELTGEPVIRKILKDEKNIYQTIVDILNNKNIDSYKNKYGDENINKIKNIFMEIKKKKITELYNIQKNEIMYQLTKELIPYKLDIIVDDIKRLKESVLFKPKFFWIVDCVKTGVSIITYIRKITKSKQNIYKNIRFGIDVSSITLDNLDIEDKKFLEENCVKLKEINGKYVAKSPNSKLRSDAIADFETDKDGSIDVLIIVGKYLTGYDFGRLLKVYLDTKVKDPKVILQMATRPTTIIENKKESFLLDLTLDNDTRESYQRALALYDDKNIKQFSIDENIINDSLNSLEKYLKTIVEFFNKQTKLLIKEGININDYSNKLNTKVDLKNNLYNLLYTLMEISNYKLKNGKNKDIDDSLYWKEIKKINKILSTLISPLYFIKGRTNYYDYIETLMTLNLLYYQRMFFKEKSNKIAFSMEEIKNMIQNTFEILNESFDEKFKNINDILKIEPTDLNNTNKINNKVKVDISSSINKIQQQLKSPPLSSDIADKILHLIEEINKNNNVIKNYKKLKDIEEKEHRKIVKCIKEEYEDELEFYIVDIYIQEYFYRLVTKNNKFKTILKKISKEYSKRIKEYIIEIYNDNIEYNEEMKVETIIKNLELYDLNFLQKILNNNELKLLIETKYNFKKDYIDKKDYYTLFKKIIIEILNKELKYSYYFED